MSYLNIRLHFWFNTGLGGLSRICIPSEDLLCFPEAFCVIPPSFVLSVLPLLGFGFRTPSVISMMFEWSGKSMFRRIMPPEWSLRLSLQEPATSCFEECHLSWAARPVASPGSCLDLCFLRTQMKGSLECGRATRMDGVFEGKLTSVGSISIGPTGKVVGNLKGLEFLKVEGQV